MAKGKDGGIFKGLTRHEIDVLRDKLTSGATAAAVAGNDRGHYCDMRDLGEDLHNAWMAALAAEFGPSRPRSLTE